MFTARLSKSSEMQWSHAVAFQSMCSIMRYWARAWTSINVKYVDTLSKLGCTMSCRPRHGKGAPLLQSCETRDAAAHTHAPSHAAVRVQRPCVCCPGVAFNVGYRGLNHPRPRSVLLCYATHSAGSTHPRRCCCRCGCCGAALMNAVQPQPQQQPLAAYAGGAGALRTCVRVPQQRGRGVRA